MDRTGRGLRESYLSTAERASNQLLQAAPDSATNSDSDEDSDVQSANNLLGKDPRRPKNDTFRR